MAIDNIALTQSNLIIGCIARGCAILGVPIGIWYYSTRRSRENQVIEDVHNIANFATGPFPIPRNFANLPAIFERFDNVVGEVRDSLIEIGNQIVNAVGNFNGGNINGDNVNGGNINGDNVNGGNGNVRPYGNVNGGNGNIASPV